MLSIKLFKGTFDHVSLLNAARDFVTDAHPEAHVIVGLCGKPEKMIVGEAPVEIGLGAAVCINSFQPHSHSFESGGVPTSALNFLASAPLFIAMMLHSFHVYMIPPLKFWAASD